MTASNVEAHGEPLYQAVTDAILGKIRAGEWAAGTRLPSEAELCRRFSVGRNTVRRALSDLVAAGMLRTVPGLGTFVAEPRLVKSAEYLLGLTQEMRSHARQVTSQVLEARTLPADPYLARRLQVQLGAEVVYLNRVRQMDGEAVALERAYLPHSLCVGILRYDFSSQSLYETLSAIYKRRPHSAEQEIEAALATPEVARLLNLPTPSVVLVFHRSTRLESGEVIEYVDSEMRADRFRFYTNLRLAVSPDEGGFRRMPVAQIA